MAVNGSGRIQYAYCALSELPASVETRALTSSDSLWPRSRGLWGEAAQPVAEAVRFKVAPKAPLTSSSSQCLAAFVHTASVSSGVGTAGALRCEFERADPEPKSPENKGISNFDAPQSRREIPTGV